LAHQGVWCISYQPWKKVAENQLMDDPITVFNYEEPASQAKMQEILAGILAALRALLQDQNPHSELRDNSGTNSSTQSIASTSR
jgi:hypothetical protein